MIKELLYKWFKLESLPCQSCETLKTQLAIANNEKSQLLNTILSLNERPQTDTPLLEPDWERVKPRMTTWNVRRQLLEAEDRKQAELLADQKKRNKQAAEINKSIESLEREVGIAEEGVKSDA